ncbi:MAG: peptidoglycan DD-metalloendopeptidase family protein [Bacteroidetes bacterium]|nr:peptidoglycan DD-metalloendopeptidase family protein [Bacteroidota bacterium]
MKKSLLLTTALITSICCHQAQAQWTRMDETISVPNTNVNSRMSVSPSPALLSKANIPQSECISPALKAQVQAENKRNREQIKAKNPSLFANRSSQLPTFIWPTQPKAGFTDYSYYTVQNLVDHNAAFPNQLQDYNCLQRTYDFGSGNHEGTDIIYWPYAWRSMDADIMEIVAAAPGIIINKRNAYPDRNCLNNGNSAWNGIIVEHADGSEAWYWHFKTGSATTKNIGDAVVAGEYLGLAGSSGSSDWPHVHFQVNDSSGNFVDPWEGPCNPTTPVSLWQNQQPYNVPSVNRVCTKSSQIDFYDCPDPEITYEKDTFQLGDSLWIWAYVRDLEFNSTMNLDLITPSGASGINWSFTVPWATWPTSYVRWYYIIDNWFVNGTWTWKVNYGGNNYEHQFVIGNPLSTQEISGVKPCIISPNPANNMFTLSVPGNKTFNEIRVIDQLGRTVIAIDEKLNGGITKTEIDCAALPAGVYYVKASSDEELFVSKFVKQ